MSVHLDINTDDYEVAIRNIGEGLQDFLPELVKESALIYRDEMKATVPVKTGKLKDSIRADIFPLSAEISTNSGYGLFVDEDTKPHIIRAVNARFLRFEIDGTVFFRKQVFHTGTTGQHFRLKTIKRATPRIEGLFDDLTRRLIT
jgi:hypothetical protein